MKISLQTLFAFFVFLPQYLFGQNELELICPTNPICVIDCAVDTDEIVASFKWYAEHATVNTNCNGLPPTITDNFNPNTFIHVNCNSNQFAIPNVKSFQSVIFTASDPCGATSSCTRTVVIVDNAGPVIEGEPYLTIRECDDLVQSEYDAWIQDNIYKMSITDACGGATWSHTPESPNEETWINGYAITEVYFIATDECGNSNSKETHFKLKNNFPPSLSELADKTIDCGSTPPAFDTPTIANSCGITTLSNIETNTPGSCPGTYTLTNTWTVTDACGASSTSVQNIFVEDNTAPETPSAPGDLTVQCSSEIPAPEELSAEDNCAGTITVLPTSETTLGACANDFTMIRTWTFDDGCGNVSTVSQTIIVHDDTAPIAPIAPIAPADILVECADEIPAPIDLSAQDNCDGEITVAPVGTIIPGDCPNQFTMIRTWTFTDICGNESSMSQTISVNDTTAPEVPMAPADLTLQCAEEVPAPIDLTAQDNCDGEITVSPTGVTTPGDCPNQFIMIRTWTFADACGNESSVNQTIIVYDDTAPVAPMAPADLTLQCAIEVPTPIDLTAQDNCDGAITVASVEMITLGDCPNQFSILRTWTFTDACGNESSVSQSITVHDDTAPDLPEAPENLMFQCAADVTEPIELSAIDNCDGLLDAVLPMTEITNGDCADQFVMVRTWTFTDACGNASSVSQTIIVHDNIAPEFTFVPEDVFQDCGEEPQFGTPEATDNCSDVIILHEDEEGDCSITRLWIVLDGCGNSNIATQTITFEDDEEPEFTFIPENVENVECNAIPDFVEPIAEDNCGSVVVTFVETSDDPDVCQDNGYGIYRVWTATDRCGNSSTVKTLLWIEEDYREPDFISFPEDLVITCDEFPPVITEEPTAIDNCSEPVITYYTEYGTGGPESCDEGEGFDWHVVWMATDACGNVQTKIQNIWVDPYLQANLGSVEGEVFNENNQMIEEVDVQVNGGNISIVETTIEDGYFDFTLPLNNNYEIEAIKNDDPLNGISTYDLILMSQHILGIETLDSPYKLIAADVNNSGTITAFDMIELRKLILLIYTELPENPSWKFVDANYNFINPMNPFVSTFPTSYSINGLSGTEIADFIGVKMGDLNSSAIPNQLVSADTRTDLDKLILNVSDQEMEKGKEYAIEFKAKDFNKIFGYQFTLDLDKSLVEFVDVEIEELPGLKMDNFGFAKLKKGVITTSWNNQAGTTLSDDAVIFRLHVKAKSRTQLSEVVTISTHYVNAEAYTSEMEKMELVLNFKPLLENTIPQKFALYQNQPNPFNDQTLIRFTLPETSFVTLTIYDFAGRVLTQRDGDFSKGYNEVVIDRSELSGAGVLYYQLETATDLATMKMIVK